MLRQERGTTIWEIRSFKNNDDFPSIASAHRTVGYIFYNTPGTRTLPSIRCGALRYVSVSDLLSWKQTLFRISAMKFSQITYLWVVRSVKRVIKVLLKDFNRRKKERFKFWTDTNFLLLFYIRNYSWKGGKRAGFKSNPAKCCWIKNKQPWSTKLN